MPCRKLVWIWKLRRLAVLMIKIILSKIQVQANDFRADQPTITLKKMFLDFSPGRNKEE